MECEASRIAAPQTDPAAIISPTLFGSQIVAHAISLQVANYLDADPMQRWWLFLLFVNKPPSHTFKVKEKKIC